MNAILKILKGYSNSAMRINDKRFISESHYKIVEQKITALIEKEYYEKEFVKYLIKHYDLIDGELYVFENINKWKPVTLDGGYNYWKLNVKEVKDTITTHDLKSINQASDDYYKRDKLFERKK